MSNYTGWLQYIHLSIQNSSPTGIKHAEVASIQYHDTYTVQHIESKIKEHIKLDQHWIAV